ncbi:MAG: alpha-E domain-containing protein [Lachnospiraceae bacterium]|nr:alpha-E domain-containing protein [Lachnospiraceae bacterium]
MGTKSVINTDRLYWLGRYSERVYTTLKLFGKSFDELIEQLTEADYSKFCTTLEIPNIYTDKDDFIARYPFDSADPNSIISNLTRAYDNAIELREEIGSEALSYIQMALYSMQKAKGDQAPAIEFQNVIDDILAFWGIVDDQIDDENTRNIIKIGKRVERLDLYARLRMNRVDINREVQRLAGRIDRCSLRYRTQSIIELQEEVLAETLNYPAILKSVESILEV